jgi:hypothetical protein
VITAVALDVTLAADDHALPVPVGAIQPERLRNSAARRDEECDQGAVAQLRLVDAGGRLRGHPLELVGLERLWKPPRELREVDRDAEVTGRPLLPRAEPQERPERDEPPVPGLGRERPATAAAASHRHLKLPEEVPVHAGEQLDAGGAGERPEAREVDAVGADGVRTAAAVEGLPVQVLLDGLGESQSGGVVLGHAQVIILRIIIISRSIDDGAPSAAGHRREAVRGNIRLSD